MNTYDPYAVHMPKALRLIEDRVGVVAEPCIILSPAAGRLLAQSFRDAIDAPVFDKPGATVSLPGGGRYNEMRLFGQRVLWPKED